MNGIIENYFQVLTTHDDIESTRRSFRRTCLTNQFHQYAISIFFPLFWIQNIGCMAEYVRLKTSSSNDVFLTEWKIDFAQAVWQWCNSQLSFALMQMK